MPPMIHLIYTSVASQDFKTDQLTDILQQAREANERVGLTGILLYSDGSFFQVLEGEPSEIDQLYQKLLLDKRHTQLTVIIREPIAKRSFGGWSMGFSSVSPEELTKIDGLNDFFENGSCFLQLDAGRTKKLLAAFAEGRWHGKLSGSKQPVA
jgi:hypothetical protein